MPPDLTDDELLLEIQTIVMLRIRGVGILIDSLASRRATLTALKLILMQLDEEAGT